MKSVIFVAALFAACGSEQSSNPAVAAANTVTGQDNTGAQGPKGDKGDQGPKGSKGDKGDKGDTGVSGASGASGATGASGAAGAAGEAGAQGAVGATGTSGPQGATGATGSVGARGAAGALALLNASNVQVGVLTNPDDLMIILPDGGFFYTDFVLGTYYGTLAYLDHQNVGAVCGFVSNDCSGQCYLTAEPANNAASLNYPVPNAVIWDGQKLWRYNGDETMHTGDVSFASYWQPNGTTNACKPYNYTVNKSWAMTHQESLPAGVTFPFGPLHFEPLQ